MATPTPPQPSTPQPLDISDLIRPLSPSPRPHASRATSPSDSVSSATPEPLDRAELDGIRSKVLEMGIVRDGRKKSGAPDTRWNEIDPFSSERERILAEMVLRLTHPSVPLPSQLFAQAETISTLNKQRDLIVSRDEEDRTRWDAERDAWWRVAGVLLERSKKEGAGNKEDLERENGQLQADNRALKTRLQETGARLHSLESELHALRPVLLLRPGTPDLTANHATDSTPAQSHTVNHPRSTGRSKKKLEPDRPVSDDDFDLGGGSGAASSPSRHSFRHQSLKSPSLGDARAEHLLLAARKIGKERAAMLSPPTYTPRQQAAAAAGNLGSNVPPLTPRTPRVRRPPSPSYSRTPSRLSQGGHSQPGFPLAAHTPRTQSLTNTDTPSGLESLLSAARTVFDHDLQDGSPAKRRRIDSAPEIGSSQLTGVGRVMSALDVLADQAAAFSSQGSGSAPPSEPMEGVETEAPGPSRLRTQSATGDSEPSNPRKIPQPALPRPSAPDPKGKGKGKATMEFPSLGPAITLRPSPPNARQSSTRPAAPVTPANHTLSTPPSHSATAEPPSSPLPGSTFDSPASSAPTAGPTPVSVRTRVLAPSPAPSATASTPGPFSSPIVPTLSRAEERLQTPKLQSEQLLRLANEMPARRQRSPYQKWSKEEDELLSKAVAKYGQKWDLVQKALPTRGYHQVRQRWLRKLGMFDAKPDLSSYQTNAVPANGADKSPAPKLGLAPLSSEMAFASARLGGSTGAMGGGSGAGGSVA